jgi:NADPH2:quinone reductase
MVLCGRTAGPTSEFQLSPFFLRHESIVGSTMGTQPELSTLVELLADDAFDPPVEDTYPLADAGDAFDAMIERDAFGKLIVEPSA